MCSPWSATETSTEESGLAQLEREIQMVEQGGDVGQERGEQVRKQLLTVDK